MSNKIHKQNPGKQLWLNLGLILLVVILLDIFIDFAAVWDTLRDTDLGYLILAALWMVLGGFFLIVRWRYILSNEPGFRATLQADGMSYMSKFFLPIPVPVLRVVALSMLTPVSISQATPGAISERMIDGIMRVIALFLAAIFYSRLSQPIWNLTLAVTFVALAIALTIWLMRNAYRVIPKLTSWLMRIPGVSRERIIKEMDTVVQALSDVSAHQIVISMLISVLIWGLFMSYYAFSFFALQLGVDLREAYTMAAVAIAFLPPSTPVMIGVYQGIMLAVLLPFGYLNSAKLTAYGILTHIIQIGLWSVVGIWGITSSGVKVSQIIQKARGFETNQTTETQEKPA